MNDPFLDEDFAIEMSIKAQKIEQLHSEEVYESERYNTLRERSRRNIGRGILVLAGGAVASFFPDYQDVGLVFVAVGAGDLTCGMLRGQYNSFVHNRRLQAFEQQIYDTEQT